MSEGWIALHRGWRDSPIFRGEFSRADAWVWLIEQAAWKPTRTHIKGTTIELERGELSFAQRFLAEKWGWSKSRVDRFISELRDEGMIETRSKIGATADHAAGQGQCIIRICNYNKYQDVQEGQRGNADAQIGATAGQQRGKEEQGNKGTIDSPNGESPPHSPPKTKSARASKFAMPADWWPAPLPADLAALVAEWPPGRFEREVADTREYWIEAGTKRPGWERTFHSRIRDIHDRIVREARNDRQRAPAATGGIAAALDRRIRTGEPPGSPGRYDAGGGGDYRALPAPSVASLR